MKIGNYSLANLLNEANDEADENKDYGVDLCLPGEKNIHYNNTILNCLFDQYLNENSGDSSKNSGKTVKSLLNNIPIASKEGHEKQIERIIKEIQDGLDILDMYDKVKVKEKFTTKNIDDIMAQKKNLKNMEVSSVRSFTNFFSDENLKDIDKIEGDSNILENSKNFETILKWYGIPEKSEQIYEKYKNNNILITGGWRTQISGHQVIVYIETNGTITIYNSGDECSRHGFGVGKRMRVIKRNIECDKEKILKIISTTIFFVKCFIETSPKLFYNILEKYCSFDSSVDEENKNYFKDGFDLAIPQFSGSCTYFSLHHYMRYIYYITGNIYFDNLYKFIRIGAINSLLLHIKTTYVDNSSRIPCVMMEIFKKINIEIKENNSNHIKRDIIDTIQKYIYDYTYTKTDNIQKNIQKKIYNITRGKNECQIENIFECIKKTDIDQCIYNFRDILFQHKFNNIYGIIAIQIFVDHLIKIYKKTDDNVYKKYDFDKLIVTIIEILFQVYTKMTTTKIKDNIIPMYWIFLLMIKKTGKYVISANRNYSEVKVWNYFIDKDNKNINRSFITENDEIILKNMTMPTEHLVIKQIKACFLVAENINTLCDIYSLIWHPGFNVYKKSNNVFSIKFSDYDKTFLSKNDNENAEVILYSTLMKVDPDNADKYKRFVNDNYQYKPRDMIYHIFCTVYLNDKELETVTRVELSEKKYKKKKFKKSYNYVEIIRNTKNINNIDDFVSTSDDIFDKKYGSPFKILYKTFDENMNFYNVDNYNIDNDILLNITTNNITSVSFFTGIFVFLLILKTKPISESALYEHIIKLFKHFYDKHNADTNTSLLHQLYLDLLSSIFHNKINAYLNTNQITSIIEATYIFGATRDCTETEKSLVYTLLGILIWRLDDKTQLKNLMTLNKSDNINDQVKEIIKLYSLKSEDITKTNDNPQNTNITFNNVTFALIIAYDYYNIPVKYYLKQYILFKESSKKKIYNIIDKRTLNNTNAIMEIVDDNYSQYKLYYENSNNEVIYYEYENSIVNHFIKTYKNNILVFHNNETKKYTILFLHAHYEKENIVFIIDRDTAEITLKNQRFTLCLKNSQDIRCVNISLLRLVYLLEHQETGNKYLLIIPNINIVNGFVQEIARDVETDSFSERIKITSESKFSDTTNDTTNIKMENAYFIEFPVNNVINFYDTEALVIFLLLCCLFRHSVYIQLLFPRILNIDKSKLGDSIYAKYLTKYMEYGLNVFERHYYMAFLEGTYRSDYKIRRKLYHKVFNKKIDILDEIDVATKNNKSNIEFKYINKVKKMIENMNIIKVVDTDFKKSNNLFLKNYQQCKIKNSNIKIINKLKEKCKYYGELYKDLSAKINLIMFNYVYYLNHIANIVNNKSDLYKLIELKRVISVLKMVIQKLETTSECLEIYKLLDGINYNNTLYTGDRGLEIIIFELLYGEIIRTEQYDIYNSIIEELQNGKNGYNIYQLLMGKGKSSVILPLIIIKYMISGNNNIMNIVSILPEQLVKQTYDDIIIKYYPMFQRTKLAILYDGLMIRRPDINVDSYFNCSQNNFYNKKITIMTNSTAKKIKLNCIEFNDKNCELVKVLKENTLYIIDEYDSQADELKGDFNYPSIEEYIDIKKQELFAEIADYIYNNNNSLDDKLKKMITMCKEKKIYNTDYGFPRKMIDDLGLEYSSHSSETFNTAVPYKATNSPIKGSKFSDMYYQFIFSVLSYKFGGFTNYHFKEMVTKINNLLGPITCSKNKQRLLNIYKKTLKFLSIDIGWMELSEGKTNTDTQYRLFIEQYTKSPNKQDIELSYIKQIYIPSIKYSKNQYNISFIDIIGNNFSKYKCGFSGTLNINLPTWNSNEYEFIKIKPIDIDNAASEVSLLGVLNRNKKTPIHKLDVEITDKTYNDTNINIILYKIGLIMKGDNNNDGYNVLIDSGAFLRYVDNDTVINYMMSILDYTTYIYIDDTDTKWVLKKLDNNVITKTKYKGEVYKTSELFIYYDNKHIVGIDIKQPFLLRGLVTVDFFNRKTDILQAMFRMRNINYGHEADFLLSTKINIKDRDSLTKHLENQDNIYKNETIRAKQLLQNIKYLFRIINDTKESYEETKYDTLLYNSYDKFIEYYEKKLESIKDNKILESLIKELKKFKPQTIEMNCNNEQETGSETQNTKQTSTNSEVSEEYCADFSFRGNDDDCINKKSISSLKIYNYEFKVYDSKILNNFNIYISKDFAKTKIFDMSKDNININIVHLSNYYYIYDDEKVLFISQYDYLFYKTKSNIANYVCSKYANDGPDITAFYRYLLCKLTTPANKIVPLNLDKKYKNSLKDILSCVSRIILNMFDVDKTCNIYGNTVILNKLINESVDYFKKLEYKDYVELFYNVKMLDIPESINDELYNDFLKVVNNIQLGGGSNFIKKYIKYKNKYMALKKQLFKYH